MSENLWRPVSVGQPELVNDVQAYVADVAPVNFFPRSPVKLPTGTPKYTHAWYIAHHTVNYHEIDLPHMNI